MAESAKVTRGRKKATFTRHWNKLERLMEEEAGRHQLDELQAKLRLAFDELEEAHAA
mgnify:CR=1 FL=1